MGGGGGGGGNNDQNMSFPITIPVMEAETSNIIKKLTKGKGRPKKGDDSRDWTDAEIIVLIELWGQKENLSVIN